MIEQDIVGSEWDNLIILDACRYDYFKKYYGNYLGGDLEKRWSKASHTRGWLAKNFTDYHDDIEYITQNSYVNEENIQLNDLNELDKEIFKEWYPQQRFREVHNIMTRYEDRKDEHNLRKPELLVEYCQDTDFHPDTRKIYHFIQPHAPYLNSKLFSELRFLPTKIDKKFGIGLKESENLRKIFINSFGDYWFSLYRKHYKYNLKRVLEVISDFVIELEGKVVVSADHGELLGENNKYGHFAESNHPILRTVPWLVMKR